MPLYLDDKKAIVASVAEQAQQAISAVVADYRGLTVAQLDDLRAKAREANVYLRVVRNTLARRAFADTEFACMNEVLVGPTILAFAKEEPSAAARLFKDFAKTNNQFTVKGLAIGGNLLGPERLDAIAALPNRQEALALLCGVMKAPITKMVRTFAAPHTKLVRTVAAIREKKESQ